MNSAEIRSRWLKFFESENSLNLSHTVVPSASLIADDPNLLLVNAGMVPFKPFFLGEVKPPYQRATSVQKCVRTLDIDEVGKTTRHASFFQMCGNFSFGDYFKEGAIALAWELLTKPITNGGYGFSEDKLWVTVYENDDEAAEIWEKKIGVPAKKIQRRGMADNFWSMGVPGPCGPCSEIYFDRGSEYGKEGGPIADEDRYLEIWNLVFMQNVRGQGGDKNSFPIVGELPAKNIDTGLGLERTAALLQGVENIYEIDTTKIILDKASALTKVKYGKQEHTDVSLRVIADHARTAMMLIGDGVTPGNEGRGYVLRRMMRRAIRNMRLLGSQDLVINELMQSAISAMGAQYPELVKESDRILAVAEAEEESFVQTLKSGTNIFDLAADQVKNSKGTVLGPDVLPYVPSEIRLDQRKLPLDSNFASVTAKTAPKWKTGVVIDFGVNRVKSAEMVLIDSSHKTVNFDRDVTIEGIEESLFVGYGGKVYITDIRNLTSLKGTACEGNECCNFETPINSDLKEPILDLGEVTCH